MNHVFPSFFVGKFWEVEFLWSVLFQQEFSSITSMNTQSYCRFFNLLFANDLTVSRYQMVGFLRHHADKANQQYALSDNKHRNSLENKQARHS